MLQEEVSDATLSYFRPALASLLQETDSRMLRVSMSGDNCAKMVFACELTKPESSWETSQDQSRVHARSLLTARTPLDA